MAQTRLPRGKQNEKKSKREQKADALWMVSRTASTQKAVEMKRQKISSVERVHQRISRETSNSANSTRKKEHHRPTQAYMA